VAGPIHSSHYLHYYIPISAGPEDNIVSISRRLCSVPLSLDDAGQRLQDSNPRILHDDLYTDKKRISTCYHETRHLGNQTRQKKEENCVTNKLVDTRCKFK
jgi:hypothetical protein